jgi:hypothetical protein
VAESVLSDTLWDLRKQFGGVTWETQVIRGQWEHEGKSFKTISCALRSMFQILKQPRLLPESEGRTQGALPAIGDLDNNSPGGCRVTPSI